ncbi:hypothetical protein AAMO2058_000586100 [Amorphochlora amoebiformis]
MTSTWSPASWRKAVAKQQPQYPDKKKLAETCATIACMPPLVDAREVKRLRSLLAKVYAGEMLILQGGDCAERFSDCTQKIIEAKLKILLQMSLVLIWGSRKPVVRIGRIAGQYGKPRSKPTEIVKGEEMASFKGDNVNSLQPNKQSRIPDPKRLLEGYFRSAATLNYIRALTRGGFADLHNAKHWELEFIKDSKLREDYEKIASNLISSLDFLRVVGGAKEHDTESVEFFTSHEGLVLDYEEALTRADDADTTEGKKKASRRFYNASAHLLWIGNRTRQLDGAHVEYFRGLSNPIGVKVGPKMDSKELVELIKTLDPNNEAGKITLISRMGANNVTNCLPPLIQAVKKAQLQVNWICDPCHGQTRATKNKIKTRDFAEILLELQKTALVHKQCGSRLNGVHFEMTGEDVTECVGGPQGLSESDLQVNYTSACDPRLNYAQSMTMSFALAKLLAQ